MVDEVMSAFHSSIRHARQRSLVADSAPLKTISENNLRNPRDMVKIVPVVMGSPEFTGTVPALQA